MKTILTVLLAMLLTGEDKLTGKWESNPGPNGSVTGVFFKKDNTFEAFINKKAFASGKYKLEGDTFTFSDNGCNGAEGVYKIIFFSGTDSLRLQPISDTCTERRKGMSRLVMGRIK